MTSSMDGRPTIVAGGRAVHQSSDGRNSHLTDGVSARWADRRATSPTMREHCRNWNLGRKALMERIVNATLFLAALGSG